MPQPLVGRLLDEPFGEKSGRALTDVAARLGKRLGRLLELFLKRRMLGENCSCEPRDFLGKQRDTRARFVAAPLELGAVARPRLLHAGTIESRGKQLFLQFGGVADGRKLQGHRLQPGQIFFDVAGLFLQLQHEKPPQSRTVRFARLVRRVEHLEAHGVPVIDQARIADERLGAAPDLHHLFEVAEIPGGDFRCRRIRAGKPGELLSSPLAELGA